MYLRSCMLAMLMVVLAGSAAAMPYREMFPDDASFWWYPKQKAFSESLDYRQGVVELPDGRGSISVGDDRYFLGADDARRLLTIWHASREDIDQALGLLVPANTRPLARYGLAEALVPDDGGYGVRYQTVSDGRTLQGRFGYRSAYGHDDVVDLVLWMFALSAGLLSLKLWRSIVREARRPSVPRVDNDGRYIHSDSMA